MTSQSAETDGITTEVTWGVELDDLGSIDTYISENAAREALADGGVLVRITTTIERISSPEKTTS